MRFFPSLRAGGFFAIAPIFCLTLSSCYGGSGSFAPQPAAVPSATAAQPASAQKASVTFTMHWPAPSATAVRKRAYVPTTAMSVSVSVNGSAPQYLNNPATTLTIAADAGADTFAFATYDQPSGQGNVLSQATVMQTITIGVTNTVSAVLSGVIAKLALSLADPNPNAGAPATVNVNVTALDADGNTIVGASGFNTPINLAVTIPSAVEAGTLSLSSPALASPSQTATLAYSGGTLTTATVSASATGVPTVSATFAPTPTFYQIPVSAVYAYGIAAGPDGNMWFTDLYGDTISRITPAGVTTTFPFPFLGAPEFITPAVDGNLWIINFGGDRVASISTSGTIQQGFDTGYSSGDSSAGLVDRGGSIWYAIDNIVGYQDEPSYLNSASGKFTLQSSGLFGGIAAGPANEIFVPEFQGGNIARVTGPYANPNISYIALPPGADAEDIVRGPDDNMWFTEAFRSKIGRLSTSSLSITEYATLNTGSLPGYISAGQDGALWFTERAPLRIGRITTGGAVAEYTAPAGFATQRPNDMATAPDGSFWITVAGYSEPNDVLMNSGILKFVY